MSPWHSPRPPAPPLPPMRFLLTFPPRFKAVLYDEAMGSKGEGLGAAFPARPAAVAEEDWERAVDLLVKANLTEGLKPVLCRGANKVMGAQHRHHGAIGGGRPPPLFFSADQRNLRCPTLCPLVSRNCVA